MFSLTSLNQLSFFFSHFFCQFFFYVGFSSDCYNLTMKWKLYRRCRHCWCIYSSIHYCSRNLFVARWDALFKCWLLPRHGWRKVTAQWWCHHSSTSCTFLCCSIHFEVSKLSIHTNSFACAYGTHTHTHEQQWPMHCHRRWWWWDLCVLIMYLFAGMRLCLFVCLCVFFFRAVMLKWLCW